MIRLIQRGARILHEDGAVFAHEFGAPIDDVHFNPWVGDSAHPPRVVVRIGVGPTDDEHPVIPWLAPARARAEEILDSVIAACVARGVRPVLLPHAQDAFSDIPSTLTLLRARGDVLGLLLDPASLMTASMLDRQAEHLTRFALAFMDLPALAAVRFDAGLADGPAAREWDALVAAADRAGVPVIRQAPVGD